ncbi:MAG: hypothetical protein ACOCZB_09320 [Spirochaetota bacterium]
MKRTVAIILLVLSLGGVALAQQEHASPVSVAGSVFLGYTDLVDPQSEIGGFAHVFNARGGLVGDLYAEIAPNFMFGAEVGLGYFTMETGEEPDTVLLMFFDLPVLAVVRYDLGPLAVEALAGYMMAAIWSLDLLPGHYVSAGARLAIGPIFATFLYSGPTSIEAFVDDPLLNTGGVTSFQIGWRTELEL